MPSLAGHSVPSEKSEILTDKNGVTKQTAMKTEYLRSRINTVNVQFIGVEGSSA